MRLTLGIMGVLIVALPVFASAQEDGAWESGSIVGSIQLGPGWGQASVDAAGLTVAETDAQVGARWGLRVGAAVSGILALSLDYVGYSSVDDEPAGFDRVESGVWLAGPALT